MNDPRISSRMSGIKRASTLLCLAICLTLAGCSPSIAADDPDPLDIEAILDRTTDFQREILDDGLVTSAEFERALLARRDCVAETGAVPGEIYEGSSGEPTFDFEVTASSAEEMREIQADAEACLQEYFADVGSVWSYQRLLTPLERDEMRPRALDCLIEAGVSDLTDESSASDMASAIQRDGEITPAERECVITYASIFTTWVDEAESGSGKE